MAIPTNLDIAAVSYNGQNIPLDGGGITPTGTKQINISANGTTTEDVTNYADAEITVAVPASAVDSGTKSITSNGNNQDVVGYAAVNVNVPNSYASSDEGKVVSNGALVSQGSDTVTQNGTVDTTLINSLNVNVPTGGASWPPNLIDVTINNIRNNNQNIYWASYISAIDGIVGANKVVNTNTSSLFTFVVNNNKISFRTNYAITSATCNNVTLTKVSSGSGTKRYHTITLPDGFNNTYPVVIN